jgi:nucleoid-associated protein YgaU
LAARARDEATIEIDSADASYATGLAPEPFDRAIQLRKEGDQSLELGDKNLGNYLQEKEDDKKAATRQVAFDEYESAYKKYNESKKTATQAKEIAINSKSDLKQSAKYVEDDLNTADSYMGGPNEKTRKERENLAQAYADIESGNLKSASERIESSKSKSRALLSESIQNFARERNLTATEVVEDATARFEEIKEEDVKNDPTAKANYESSRENIGAANESLASAGNLYAQEKYEDSIRQSEEAIRLSGIVVEQTAKLTPQSLTKRNSGIENGKDSNKSDSTKISKTNKNKSSDGNNLSEGWTKYKVKNQKPEDCLWRIAESKSNYGNGKLWKRIYEANKSKIKNKNLIYPNQVLYIPPKTGTIDSPFKEDEPKKEMVEQKDEIQPKEESTSIEGTKDATDPSKEKVESGKPVNGPDEEPNKTGTEEEILEETPIEE